MVGLIGRKIGMSQIFTDDGQTVPVTAIEAGPCPILQVKTEERDGYRAIQLGFGKKKPVRSNKPERGRSERAGVDHVPTVLREFRLGEDDLVAENPHEPASPRAAAIEAEAGEEGNGTNGEPEEGPEAEATEGETAEVAASEQRAPEEEVESEPLPDGDGEGLRVGQILTVRIFSPGDRVKITGRTKGRGFQGVVKRHGFRGRPKTHGHPSVRVPGSIGPGTDPSRVLKGRRMPGQMGNERRTIRNLEVVRVDPSRNLLFIKGSVPGARNGWLFIRKQ